MTWIVKCENCGNIRKVYVSYNIKNLTKIYIYCPKCRKNTFHIIIEKQ